MENKKKIVVLSGAGISQPSGIATFRDSKDSLWNNFKIEEIATKQAWHNNREKVLDFYNERRRDLLDKEPNQAHIILKELELDFDVVIVTQNVDNLHEKARSKKIIHLHGQLLKNKSSLNPSIKYDSLVDIKIGDKCHVGSQLRHDIILFGEMLGPEILDAERHMKEADIVIIIGTSMNVSPANRLPFISKENTPIYYVDLGDYKAEDEVPTYRLHDFNHIQKDCIDGMKELKDKLRTKYA